MKARIIAYSFMILLLAAHFLRANDIGLMIIVLLLPFLFFVKKPWAIQVLQVVAYAGAFLWIFTAYETIVFRVSEERDWLRLMIILFSVAIYSAWTGYFLNSGRVKDIYDESGDDEAESSPQ